MPIIKVMFPVLTTQLLVFSFGLALEIQAYILKACINAPFTHRKLDCQLPQQKALGTTAKNDSFQYLL